MAGKFGLGPLLLYRLRLGPTFGISNSNYDAGCPGITVREAQTRVTCPAFLVALVTAPLGGLWACAVQSFPLLI